MRVDRRARVAGARVYLIVTPSAVGPGWEEALRAALATGLADLVQVREKTIDDDAFVRLGLRFRALCNEGDALLVVNDRVDLVAPIDADGVHLGEEDATLEEARRRLGPDVLVGVSTHDGDEVAAARSRGADLAGLGPCYASTTKRLARPPGGAALVRSALPRAGDLPLFPIGGITPANAGPLVDAGARRLAVGAGVLMAPDPAAAIRALDERLRTARGSRPDPC